MSICGLRVTPPADESADDLSNRTPMRVIFAAPIMIWLGRRGAGPAREQTGIARAMAGLLRDVMRAGMFRWKLLGSVYYRHRDMQTLLLEVV